MTQLLADVGTFFQSFLVAGGQVLSFITDQPMLAVFVILAIVAVALRYLRKWLPGL